MKTDIKMILFVFLCVFQLALSGKHDGGKKSHGTGYMTESPRNYTCHEGFIAEGYGPNMRCIMEELVPSIAYCANGGMLQGDVCMIREPAMFTCPPGYASTDGGKKKKHSGGVCMAVDRAPMDMFCANGGMLSGNMCLIEEVAPLTQICPLSNGGKKHGGHHGGHHGGLGGFNDCVDYHQVMPLLTCPEGLLLQGANCIGLEQRACPVAAPYHEKKKHGHGGHGHGHGGHGHGGHGHGGHGHGGSSYGYSMNAGYGHGHRMLGEKHGHVETVMVPSKQKSLCEVEIAVPALEVCPEGTMPSNDYGSHGGKKHHGSGGLVCLEAFQIPLEPYCPFEGGLMDLNTNTCVMQRSLPAATQCPMGFSLCSHDKKKKHGGHHGGHHGGNGFGFMNDQCCAVSYADPLPGCPPEFTLYGNQCKMMIEPLFQCPPNAIMDGSGNCIIVISKPPKVDYTIQVVTKAAPMIHKSKKHGHGGHGSHGGHGGKHH